MRYWSAVGALLIATLSAGCNITIGDGPHARVGDLREENVRLDKSKAEIVNAQFHIGAGEIRIRGGAEKLMDAKFRYNVDAWKPEVRYDSTGFRGRLDVRQGSGSISAGNNTKNDWDIQLANDVPIDLTVACGAGEGHFDLRGMTLRSVQVKIGAGQVGLDLHGDHKRSFDVKVEGGVGEAVIRVPKNVGIIAEARGGIGSINVVGLRKEDGRWVNDAVGKSPATIRIDARGGIGEIRIVAD